MFPLWFFQLSHKTKQKNWTFWIFRDVLISSIILSTVLLPFYNHYLLLLLLLLLIITIIIYLTVTISYIYYTITTTTTINIIITNNVL